MFISKIFAVVLFMSSSLVYAAVCGDKAPGFELLGEDQYYLPMVGSDLTDSQIDDLDKMFRRLSSHLSGKMVVKKCIESDNAIKRYESRVKNVSIDLIKSEKSVKIEFDYYDEFKVATKGKHELFGVMSVDLISGLSDSGWVSNSRYRKKAFRSAYLMDRAVSFSVGKNNYITISIKEYINGFFSQEMDITLR